MLQKYLLSVLYQRGAEKIAALKIKIHEAHETVKAKKKEAKDNRQRCAKAEWAISLCTRRVPSKLLYTSNVYLV